MTEKQEFTRLPGFGFDITHFPASPQDDAGRRVRFPHAIADYCGSQGVTLRERRMLEFINQVTDKPEWERKVFDEAITAKWRAEACVRREDLDDEFLSTPMFDCCMEELRDKAAYYKKSGIVSVWDCETAVAKSDVLVSALMAGSLRDSVRALEDVPDKEKDWHPGSGKKVLDLLHPSLFPLIYGRSKALPFGTVPLEDCSRFIGEGEPVDSVSEERVHKKNVAWRNKTSLEAWGSFQWLPSNIHFSEAGLPKITSYVNNLHPQVHKDLYEVLEQFVAVSIPLWNECLSWFEKRFRIEDHRASLNDFTLPTGMKYYPPRDGADDQSDSDGRQDGLSLKEAQEKGMFWDDEFLDWFSQHRILIQKEPNAFRSRQYLESRFGHNPVDLQKDFHSAGLQIIFKLANIHLTPENPEYEGGSWHIEGALNEHICATALYYYDQQNIADSHIAFRQSINPEDMSYEQHEWDSLEMYYGIRDQESTIQDLGRVLTRPGRLLAFPNILQHQVQPFHLTDPTKPGHRKILAMFLVDPYVRVLSTANVPPQRRDWWAVEVRKVPPFSTLPQEVFDIIIGFVDGFPLSWEEAMEVRQDLMDERGALVDEVNDVMEEDEFGFCEH